MKPEHQPNVSSEERDLVRLAQSGDERALNEIWTRYESIILSLALRIVQNWHDAEDVRSEVAHLYVRKFSSFRGDSTIHTWFHVMTHNTSINLIVRKVRRRKNLGGLSFTDEEHSSGTICEEVPDESDSAPTAITKKEWWGQTKLAIENLSPDYRQAIELFYLEGLSHDEISRITGDPEGTIRSRVSLALNQIRGEVYR